MAAGKSYDVSFLSVDAVGHSALASRYGEQELQCLLDEYYTVVTAVTRELNGKEWSWGGDGGLYVFRGPRHVEHAVLAGISLVDDVKNLRINRSKNPCRIPLRVRLAVSTGRITYRKPRNRIFADCINQVVQLQEQSTEPDELTLTAATYRALPAEIRELLSYKGTFEKQPIYRYALPRKRPDDSKLGRLLSKVENKAEALERRYAGDFRPKNSGRAISQTIYLLKEIFSDLEQFRAAFSNVDEKWSETYLQQVAAKVERLLAAEERAASGIRRWLERLPPSAFARSEIRALQQVSSLEHAESKMLLSNLQRQLEAAANGCAIEAAPKGRDNVPRRRAEPSADLLRYAKRLALLPPDGAAAGFVAVAACDRSQLISLVKGETPFSERHSFLERLSWLPDLVVTEDLRMGHKRGLFSALCASREVGPQFQVLAELFKSRDPHSFGETIHRRFTRRGIWLPADVLEAHSRALIIAHPSVCLRYVAVSQAKLDALWVAVANHATPMLTLRILAERLPDWQGDDAKKIFFDCVEQKASASITGAERPWEVKMLEELLSIFMDQGFFGEQRYFLRLEQMILDIAGKARELGVELGIFAKWAPILSAHRNEASGQGPDVDALPTPVKRYLARRGLGDRYSVAFACQTNNHVAKEVTGHVTAGNVDRFASEARINRAFLASLMKNRSLFAREGTQLAALKNPRCSPIRAGVFLKALPSHRVSEVANSRTANCGVKEVAFRLLARRSW